MYHRTNIRGKLIISKNNDFYSTYHKLNIIIINGTNNKLHINHRIHKLIINGNNNDIEINPLGNVKRIILKGNTNKINSKYSKALTLSDLGLGNKLIFDSINNPDDSDTSDIEIQPQRYVINQDEYLESTSEENVEEDDNVIIQQQQNLVFEIVHNINLAINLTVENILNNLVNISYKSQGNQNNDKCPICFENFKENEQVKMTFCFHVFHLICIKKWIETKLECPDCPICRRKI